MDWGREMKRNNSGARMIVVNDMGTRGEW